MLALLALLACAPKDEDPPLDSDTDSDPPAEDTEAGMYATADELLILSAPMVGDTTCFDPSGDWGAQAADPSCQVLVDVTGDIEDFQSGDGVPLATIELFWSDRLGDTPDSVLTSDVDGNVSGGQARTCSPFTARIYTDAQHEDTKLTLQQHWTEGPGDPMDTFFNSVATGTYLLIPAILGIRPDPTRGIVAGTAYHCGGEGRPAENVQILLKDDQGRYHATARVHYFQEEFPSTDQPTTSADGLWMALEVPAGEVTVEMWGILTDGGEPQLLGSTRADVLADGITITDVYLGDDDGVKLDASCLAPCGL